LPIWQQLNLVLPELDAHLVGISLHGRSATARYRVEHQLAWPVWVVSDSDAVAKMGITSVPTTVAVSKDQKVLGVWHGQLNAHAVEEIREVIEQELNDTREPGQ
jgi:hypothetical protein